MDPAALTGPRPPGASDADLCAREHEYHTRKAITWLDADPPDEGTIASAQVHATLALAWATRLDCSLPS